MSVEVHPGLSSLPSRDSRRCQTPIWLSVSSTVLPNTTHHLVCIPSGAPHCPHGAPRKARHLPLGACGQTSALRDGSWLRALPWLTTTPLLHVATAHRSQSSQLLIWANSAHWAFMVCHYTSFSKTWTPLDPVFRNLSYTPAPFPKYCGNSLSDHAYSCTSSLIPLKHSARIRRFHWLPQIQY